MDDILDIPVGVIRHDELLHGLRALAGAHLAGDAQDEFNAGFIAALCSVATLVGIERQFMQEAIKIQRNRPKRIEDGKGLAEG